MASHNNENDEILKDADMSLETQLCEHCSYLFSAWDDKWIGDQTHHEGYESLLRSVKAGCRLCDKLKDVWDHFASGIQDPTCCSFINFSMVSELTLCIASKPYSEVCGKYYKNYPLSMTRKKTTTQFSRLISQFDQSW